LKFAPVPIPAMALLQQHDAQRDILTEPAAQRGGVQRSKVGGIWNWGHFGLGMQSGRKNQQACFCLCI